MVPSKAFGFRLLREMPLAVVLSMKTPMELDWKAYSVISPIVFMTSLSYKKLVM
jgi:hypothetical protein